MRISKIGRIAFVVITSLAALALTCELVAAQNVQGVINGRSGATMTLQTQNSGNVVVVLTPYTEVDEVEGLLKARKKEMGVTALIPGLPVQVQGTYNAQNQLVANTVKFKADDLKNAQDIQAGVNPTEQLA
jgi:OOP family OmpA-OmpF porin